MKYLSVTIVAVLLIATEIHGAFLQRSSSSSITVTTTNQIVRLRANRLRRPEACKDTGLSNMRLEDFPNLSIVGRIKEVYLSGDNGQPLTVTQLDANTLSNLSTANNQRALVNIERIFKGNKDLLNTDIIVTGFNGTNSTPCPNFIKPNDTWIMLLDNQGDRKYSINGNNLFNLNLSNLDRLNSIVMGEPYKRRPAIEDILCEAHYCPYGRCRAKESGELECHCPDYCDLVSNPICGSDNTTYTNECHLIKEGCNRQKPLFVTKLSAC